MLASCCLGPSHFSYETHIQPTVIIAGCYKGFTLVKRRRIESVRKPGGSVCVCVNQYEERCSALPRVYEAAQINRSCVFSQAGRPKRGLRHKSRIQTTLVLHCRVLTQQSICCKECPAPLAPLRLYQRLFGQHNMLNISKV